MCHAYSGCVGVGVRRGTSDGQVVKVSVVDVGAPGSNLDRVKPVT